MIPSCPEAAFIGAISAVTTRVSELPMPSVSLLLLVVVLLSGSYSNGK